MEWMLMPYRRYAEFSGRSRRKEYWMFALLGVIVSAVLYALILAGGGMSLISAAVAQREGVANPDLQQVSFGPLFWIGCILLVVCALASIIPSIAVTVRRLHDRNMSGWYVVGFFVVVIVLNLIPIIGQLIVLVLEIAWIVLLALPGTPGPNKYGPDPLGQANSDVFA